MHRKILAGSPEGKLLRPHFGAEIHAVRKALRESFEPTGSMALKVSVVGLVSRRLLTFTIVEAGHRLMRLEVTGPLEAGPLIADFFGSQGLGELGRPDFAML